MKNFSKWLVPGVGLKRWLLLAASGVLAESGGVIALTIAIHRTLHWKLTLDLWLSSSGSLLIILGMSMAVIGGQNVVRVVVHALRTSNTPSLIEALYRSRSRRGPRIVVIGGGTGLSSVLRGLKAYSDNLTAIVTMADDGGSSGRLRAELGALPPGDVRNCLVALAGEEELLAALFNYRFPQGGLEGHSFGNLFITALANLTGDLEQAIQAASRVLAIRGQVLPATLSSVELVARLADGSMVRGESAISHSRLPICEVKCDPANPPAVPAALRAIREADAIVLGPGSLYTSVLPNLLITEILNEIRRSMAPKIYICNVMTQPGETDNYTVSHHIKALQRIGGTSLFSYVLVNQDPPQRLLGKYEEQGQHPVELDLSEVIATGVTPIAGSFLDEQATVRHDSAALARALFDWLTSLKREQTGKLSAKPWGGFEL
ncbi:MAG: YvcK family protein [Cyanobacteria bacterium NC_groundwater_1444_Ag_S-0.65um_54_12]|nr:YvcK family protein [Cyanobacteria bacterium NC_groundwater_1444_Ag_S-0.65um_54_12]